MEGDESKSLALQMDSQISPEISVHLAENVEGFQQCVKEVLESIEQDENFWEMTAENYDQKKSYLTRSVEELSRMHRLLADQHAYLIEEVRKNRPSLIKMLHLGSSESSSHNVKQLIKHNQISNAQTIRKPSDYDVLMMPDRGGFYLSKKEGSSDSGSESFMSVNKLPVPAVNDDALKVKEANAPVDLLKKISNLEEELVSLNNNLQSLREENTGLKQEIEENVSDIELYMSDSKLKIKTMEKGLEESKLHNKRANYFMSGLLLEKAVDKAMHERQVGELNMKVIQYVTEISELKRIHEARENVRNAVIRKLRDEVQEKCESVDGFKKKLDALTLEKDEVISQLNTLQAEKCSQDNVIQELQTRVNALQFENVGVLPSFDNVQKLVNELKLKVEQLEREVDKQKEVMSDGT